MISGKKQIISRKFSRAAESYDSFSHVQKKSAGRLANSFPESFSPATALEIGCGTGNYTLLLRQAFPEAEIWAIDFSQAMVKFAQSKLTPDSKLHFLCADGEEYLAARKASFDLITSNATLQWFDDLESAFRHAAAMLSAGGHFHISLFGPKTLSELGSAFEDALQVRMELPASFFSSLDMIRSSAEKYFSEVLCEEQSISRRYDSLPDLLRHIQKTGAGGFHSAMPVLTKKRLKKIDSWFVARGGYEVHYQVYYVTAKGAHR